MPEQEPRPKIGLEQLSPEGLEVFLKFVGEAVKPEDRLMEVFLEELQAMPNQDLDRARSVVTSLARSELPDERIWACHAVPYLAAEDPETGFPLWGELVRDTHLDVSAAAEEAVLGSVGVLELDPERVAEVMRICLDR
jgi:hypothetical protein